MIALKGHWIAKRDILEGEIKDWDKENKDIQNNGEKSNLMLIKQAFKELSIPRTRVGIRVMRILVYSNTKDQKAVGTCDWPKRERQVKTIYWCLSLT